MKAITIKQPYATLLALGYKKYETRSWQTTYRGKLAIHAGKAIDKEACAQEEIAELLREAGYHSWRDLPTGAVIAIGELTDCYRVLTQHKENGIAMTQTEKIDGLAYRLGDFSVGRYAWEVQKIERLDKVVPCRGRLSLWEWT